MNHQLFYLINRRLPRKSDEREWNQFVGMFFFTLIFTVALILSI